MLDVNGKNIVVFGFGRCGVSLIKYLHQKGAQITVHDRKTRGELGQSLSLVGKIEFKLNLGRTTPEAFAGADLVIVSNSIKWNLPELQQVRSSGTPMIYEMDFGFQALENRPKTLLITGQVGKSSVAFMLAEVLKKTGKNVFLQGELGFPLTEASLSPNKFDALILDSSHSLVNACPSIKTNALVVTNTHNNILIDDLRKVLATLEGSAVMIINQEDETCRLIGTDFTGRLLRFMHEDVSKMPNIDYNNYEGAFMQKKRLMTLRFKGENYQVTLEKYNQEGRFCRENLMAVCCGAACFGVPLNILKEFIAQFKGAPHRLEFVRRKDAVNFYNDSISCDIHRVSNAVRAFDQQVILIMGGKDEDKEYERLVDTIKKKVKCLILVGESKERINRIIGDYTETYLVGTFEEAVFMSYQKTRSGDIVLLAPGSDATDLFKRYEERGEYYRKLVHQI